MRHRATPDFWYYYRQLPDEIQKLANRCYKLLKQDPRYPSLHFKKVGSFWSVRVGIHYRALAVEENDDIAWFWIGTQGEYTSLLPSNVPLFADLAQGCPYCSEGTPLVL